MAPPGRRRIPLSLLSILIALLLLFTSTASAASAVLGVDLGTEYLKAVLVKPGIPLEIVLTKDSKRKEFSAVAFKPHRDHSSAQPATFPERSYGGDAMSLSVRFPGDVYPNLKPLLGLPVGEEGVVAAYRTRYPELDLVPAPGTRGTVGFKSKAFHAGELPFMVEELLAMELKNLRENAQAMAGQGLKIENAVFVVPAFYTEAEKRAVQAAAELAGFKVIGLVSDGLAVGINYATSREFPIINEGGKPEFHLVLDMGAGSTTATVLRMNGRTVKDVGRYNKSVQEVTVLGVGADRTLGGDALNHIILDDMVEKFVETPGVKNLGKTAEDVKRHGRTAAKLWREAEKVRQVLSANQQTVASFEGLYDDIDFKYKVSRNDFEDKAVGFAERLEAPVNQALKAANLTFADINSVILHGGAVRTPFVQKKLESMVGDASKLRSNVNADEAAVFGAAFKAARLSPSFRVKEIRDYDAAGHSTFLYYKVDGKPRSIKLFTPSSSIGVTKQVPFKDLEGFSFTLSQTQGSSEDSATSTQIKTTNLTDSVKALEKKGCKPEDISTEFAIRLDPIFGLPEVVEGTVSCEVEGKDGSVVDSVKGLFGFGKKGDDKQQPLKESESEAPPSSDSSSSSSTSSSSSKNPKSTDTIKDASKDSAKPTKKREVIKVGFTATQDDGKALPPEEFKRMKERLVAFDRADKARKEREEDINNLESYLYQVRDYLDDTSFVQYSSDAVRQQLDKLRQETSEWMTDTGSSTSEELKAKLKALRNIVSPVLKRKAEAQRRPEYVDLLHQALNQTKMLVGIIQNSIQEAARAESSSSSLLEAMRTASEASASASTSASSGMIEDAQETKTATGVDPLAELEEPELPPVWTATADASSTPTPEPEQYSSPYSADDLEELLSEYDSVAKWLEEKLKLQENLQEWEDPVFETGELERKAKGLNDAFMRIMRKGMTKPKIKKPTVSKAGKSKASKNVSTRSSGGKETTVTTSGDDEKTSADVGHDEL